MFEPDHRDRQEVVNKTKVEVDGEGVYIYAVLDCDALEVFALEESLRRFSLDALCFFETC